MRADPVRINKYIAGFGVASRRRAEELILEGRVTLNGKVVYELGTQVLPDQDAVKVDGKLLASKSKPIYVLLNKPRGYVTTLKDPEGRPTVKDLLKGLKTRVFPVGRLDFESEGLLLLTNDGEFAQKLTHPQEPLTKEYLVKIEGKPDYKELERLKTGVPLADGRARALELEKVRKGDNHDWYRIVVREGRNKMVQRMFERVGFDVLKVKRVAIGKLSIGRLDRGEYRLIRKFEANLALQSTVEKRKLTKI